MLLQPGTHLDNYEIVSELGSGSMGEVYKAKDLKLGRYVAIKVLRREMASDSERLRRFEQEARAASALNHPNIVTIYDIGEQAGTPYIAMEYVNGLTLRAILARDVLPMEMLMRYATQMAEGLAKAHQTGIVHRDLKPENIVVSVDGYVKILDFGLAKLLPHGAAVGFEYATTLSKVTTPGTILGTLGYMSPEQARGEAADYRSDQFSFGAILYEMATRTPAFKRTTAAETLSAVLRDEPPRIEVPLPSPILEVLGRCLAKSPDNRFQSTTQLPEALRAANPATPPRRAGPQLHSIAVLPLRDLNPAAGEEYFADAMTEALITELAKIRALKVISRTSVMRFKDTNASLTHVARELGADAIVEGSVLRAGDRVRISGQLVEVASDQHLWANSYERDLRDILSLQSEVAREVARQVHANLTPEEEGRLAGRPRIEPASHDAYAKGRFYFYKWTEADFEKAIQHFRHAIDIDPKSAEAYAGLADCYLFLSIFGYWPPEETSPPSKAAALKALELDDSLGEAWNSIGTTRLVFDWDWPGAEKAFQQALEFSPNSANAHMASAVQSIVTGRLDDGIAAAKRACEIDPLTATTANHLGFCYFLARRYDESRKQLEKTTGLGPELHYPHVTLSCIHAKSNRLPDARAEVAKALSKLPGDDVYALGTLGWVLGKTGRPDEARQLLTRLSSSRQPWIDPSCVAMIHDGLDNRDRAVQYWNDAFDRRSPNMIHLATHPLLDDLRTHSGFLDLLHRMKFPE